MTAKDELKQYRFKVKKVEQALEEYERFKIRAEKVTSVLSDSPARSNKTSDKVGDNAILMADLSEKYKQLWAEAEVERLSLIGNLNGIDEPYRTILFLRYVKNENFGSIASEVGYSYKQILRLHGYALEIYKKSKDVL